MIDYILDTHTLLWSIFDSNKLSQSAQTIVLDRNFYKFISISTMWEISIKNRIGKLSLPKGLAGVFFEIEMSGFGIIGIDRQCIEIYDNLTLLHRDPFGREYDHSNRR